MAQIRAPIISTSCLTKTEDGGKIQMKETIQPNVEMNEDYKKGDNNVQPKAKGTLMPMIGSIIITKLLLHYFNLL